MSFYVYQYLREDKTPYYVGKGSKNRINESHAPWVELPPVEQREIVEEGLTEEEAWTKENELIRHYGRIIDGGILKNIKLNKWTRKSGWKHSEEAKKKISEGNTGKVRSLVQKKNYKGTKTIEHTEKIRKANLGRKNSKERNLKIQETMKKKRWYTNGIDAVFCDIDSQLKGYILGRKIKNVMA